MPALNWIGKKAVATHHREVPFHLLEADARFGAGEADSGNLIVQGDNLLALKAGACQDSCRPDHAHFCMNSSPRT